jgi:hypothetical protein
MFIKSKPMRIEKPLVIMFEGPDGNVVCHIHPSKSASSYRAYGLLICDRARHVARAFNVREDEVWEWVGKERNRPTTDITDPH